MKRISTFITSCLLMLSVAATAREPQVNVSIASNSNPDYDISIDGTYYNEATTITNLSKGTHTVQVYKVTGVKILGLEKKRELLSTRQFSFSTRDVSINVDNSGRLAISQSGSVTGANGNDDDWNKNSNNNVRGHKNGKCTNSKHHHKNDNWKKGKGKKKGHYKNHKGDADHTWNKNKKNDKDDDNR